jgi:uncharacterized protein YndB with AHSA1/START domain
MNDASALKSVVIERHFGHGPEKVWRALTQAPLMEEWLMMTNDFRPAVGHRFQLRAPAQPGWDGVIDCEVLDVESQRTLSYTWSSLGVRTVVTFTLEAAPGGTHLRMEQSGFRADQEQNYRGAQYGWQKFLAALESVVAKLA